MSADVQDTRVRCHLDRLLKQAGLTGAELARRVGLHENSLSKLRQGDFAFIRMTTMEALCLELACQPGDLLTVETD
jgi:putative transcriptional regulator